MRSVTPIKTAKISYIIMSAFCCALGFMFIIFPDFSMKVMGATVGIGLIVFGAVKILGYFSKDLFRLAFQYDLAFGCLLVILGTIVLLKPHDVLKLVCAFLGFTILADGLFKIQISVDSKKFGIKQWWLILSMAILTGIFGLILLSRPEQGAQTLMILLGLSVFIEGLLNLSVVLTSVKIIDHQRPDVIDIEIHTEI